MTAEEIEEILRLRAKKLSEKECQSMVYPEHNWEDGYVYGYKDALKTEMVKQMSDRIEKLEKQLNIANRNKDMSYMAYKIVKDELNEKSQI